MKKHLWLIAALCLVMGMGACSKDIPADPVAPADVTPPEDEAPQEDPAILTIGLDSGDQPVSGPLDGLILDEYDGIAVTAVIRERRALLSGGSIPVTVIVENNGDKSVMYVQGSGRFTTPEALFGSAEHLQYVPPEDNLGIATLDFVVRELKPGEKLEFKLFFMATEPNADFMKYSQDEFFTNKTYIANMPWEDIHKAYPDLIATEPGSYEASIYFTYALVGEGPPQIFMGSSTGYAKGNLLVGIS